MGTMTTEAECYRILGVEPGATMEEIRAAYRRAACEHHPDLRRNDGATAERKLRELIVAYKFLARRLDPAAWARGEEDRKTFTPQDFAREGYRQASAAEDVITAEESRPNLVQALRSKDARPTRDETRAFIYLWLVAVVAAVAVSGVYILLRSAMINATELPPHEVVIAGALAALVYALLTGGAAMLVVLTRKLVRITLKLKSRWLFLPGPRPDNALPKPATKLRQDGSDL